MYFPDLPTPSADRRSPSSSARPPPALQRPCCCVFIYLRFFLYPTIPLTQTRSEPPFQINGSAPTGPPRWRQMKHACGENPSRVYQFTRMDTIWSFRKIYNEARKVRDAQDKYCAAARLGNWRGLGAFPESLEYEALVDVLRGRVKVHTHCYEAVDLDALVRLSQEFRFPIAAVHHAHEAYLVPDLLKSAYGAFSVPPPLLYDFFCAPPDTFFSSAANR
jgi:hypothetical protein